jgi:hypothetical protein
MITRLQANYAAEHILGRDRHAMHLSTYAFLDAAAIKCFLEKIENEHSEIIRRAIKQLNDGQYLI